MRTGKNVYKDAVDIYKKSPDISAYKRMYDRAVKSFIGAGIADVGADVLDIPIGDGSGTTEIKPKIDDEVTPVPTTFEIDPTQLDLPDPSAPLTDAIDREREALKTQGKEAQGMLDAAEARNVTDAAARKQSTDALISSGEKGIAGLTTSREDIKGAGEQNLRWLVEGQGKTREAQQKVIDDIIEFHKVKYKPEFDENIENAPRNGQ